MKKRRFPALLMAAFMLSGCGHIEAEESDVPVTTEYITSETTTEAVTDTTAEVVTVTDDIHTTDTEQPTTVPTTAKTTASAQFVVKTTAASKAPAVVTRRTTAAPSDDTPTSAVTVKTTTVTKASKTTTKSTTVTTAAKSTTKTTTKTTASKTTTKTTTVTTATTKPTIDPDLPLAEQYLDNMTLHEKVCQMFIVVPEHISTQGVYTSADSSFTKGYEKYPVGGLIFFAQNIVSSDQTSKMTKNTQKVAHDKGVGMFMAIDEEGGKVTRIQQKLGTTAFNNMSYYGDLNDYDTSYNVGATIGSYLDDYGFNVDFAPVADVNISSKNELGARIFSSDPDVVAQMTAAVVSGLRSEGVCSTLKHFPGLGAGNGNTHYGAVVIDRTFDELVSAEFKAFSGGIDAGTDFVMVGHQITTAAGDDLPGDLSRVVVTDWLRDELGFDGIAVTDSQAMGAIKNYYTSGDAAVRSIEAGIDIILMPYDLASAVKGVEDAVKSGRLSESRIDESVLRILEKKDELGLLKS